MSNSTTTFIALRGIVFLRELENSTRRICSIDTTALQESDQTRLQIYRMMSASPRVDAKFSKQTMANHSAEVNKWINEHIRTALWRHYVLDTGKW